MMLTMFDHKLAMTPLRYMDLPQFSLGEIHAVEFRPHLNNPRDI